MTPKEKAKQLFEKFIDEITANQEEDMAKFMAIDINCAKQCALIAVDELISSHLLLKTTHEREPSIRCKSYWQLVKQEIEKL